MDALLYAGADEALCTGHQRLIGLRELRLAQAIKRIVEMNLQGSRLLSAAQPCLCRALETLASARVTISPMCQAAARRIRAQQSHRARRELQGDRNRGLETPPDGRARRPARDIDRLGAATDRTRATGAAPPRATSVWRSSRRSAAFSCRALSALVERVMCHKHITS